MTTRPLINRVATLAYTSAQIGRTVRGPHMMGAAETANVVALARPSRGFNLYRCGVGVFAASYTRTHAAINQAVIEWFVRLIPPTTGLWALAQETFAVSLTIRDAAGNSVTPPDTRIPVMLANTVRTFTPLTDALPGNAVVGGSGYLDLDALATTLTDPSWSFEFTVSHATGTLLVIDRISMRELARTIVDTSDAYGVDVADFQPGQPQSAGTSSTIGTLRLAKTIEGGIAATDDVLVLGWEDSASALDAPSTTSASYAAMSLLSQAAGVPIRWRVPVRPMYVAAPPGDATGETGRFRVRYYVSGGGTADVQLLTGSSGSPYAVTGLTGASWQWSPWTDCRLPTNGTDTLATLSVKARTSAGTLYLSGVHVQQT